MSTEFRHEALFYRGDDEYLEGIVPYLREGVEAGQTAMVTVRAEKADTLRAELGDAADRVFFADVQGLGRNPARIIPFWCDFLDDHGGSGEVRGVGEPVWPQRTPAELDECERHEVLLDHAFGLGRAWSLLCPYDSSNLDDDVLDFASRAHSDPRPEPHPFAGDLAAVPSRAERMDFARADLHAVRGLVAAHAGAAGLAPRRAEALVTAASELAANSVLHGGGGGSIGVWEAEGRVLVETEDRGTIGEPLVGRVRPEVAQLGGRGLWLANQLCDLMQIRSGSGGTRVRLQMAIA
jgi:anti-sigma regulatory factor (Ser/Thr protein kinase)